MIGGSWRRRDLRRRLDEICKSQPAPVIDLTSHKVPELKELLRRRGLPIKGNKPDLIARLSAASHAAGWGASGQDAGGEGAARMPLAAYVQAHVWNFDAADAELERQAMAIWKCLEPPLRHLPRQVELYDTAVAIAKLSTGATFYEALAHAPLVITLMRDSGDVEPDLQKHLSSAHALHQFAQDNACDVAAARSRLDLEARRALQAQFANLDTYASVGYHVIVNLERWRNALKDSLTCAAISSASHRLRVLDGLRQSRFDTEWCIGLSEIAPSITGEADVRKARLSELYSRAQHVVNGIMSESRANLDRPCPAMNMPACTYQDP